jgi:hypothetical protein
LGALAVILGGAGLTLPPASLDSEVIGLSEKRFKRFQNLSIII